MGTQSGVLGGLMRPLIRGAQAWVAAVNASGGLNCHKVQYLVGDDGADPARQQALVRQFVEKDGVIAFVMPDAPITAEASKDYLIQKQVPVIGNEGAGTFAYGSPVHFIPYAVGIPLLHMTIAAAAKVTIPEGKRKAALFVCELDPCSQALQTYTSDAPKVGYDLVWNGRGSLTQPDFTAQCLEMKNSAAQVVLGAFDPTGWHRVADDCAKISYKPTFVALAVNSDETFKDDPNMDGTIIGLMVRPWFQDNNPAIREYQQAIAKFLPGGQLDAGTVQGWTTAKTFERAARGLVPNVTPSSTAILAGLKGIKGDDLGGLAAYPVDFSMPAPRPQIACGWAVVLHNGAFGAEQNPICAGSTGAQPQVVAADHPASVGGVTWTDADRRTIDRRGRRGLLAAGAVK